MMLTGCRPNEAMRVVPGIEMGATSPVSKCGHLSISWVGTLRRGVRRGWDSTQIPLSYLLLELLGHTQARTTQRYAHVADDPLKEAADRIGNAIAGTGKGGADVVKILGGASCVGKSRGRRSPLNDVRFWPRSRTKFQTCNKVPIGAPATRPGNTHCTEVRSLRI